MKAGTEVFSSESALLQILSLQLLAAFIFEASLAHCAEQLYILSLIDILENIHQTVQ